MAADIYVMDADGGNVRQFTDGAVSIIGFISPVNRPLVTRVGIEPTTY